MVNETNKPENCLENEQLGQRLAASNQALLNMQAEHRQLLEEMEQLRKRAEDLQRIKEQQEREEEAKRLEYEKSLTKAAELSHSEEENENDGKICEEPKLENIDEGDPEEADYIKEKLAEIARLKAQFKRVQHMINTTELIENHISKNETVDNPKPIAESVIKPEEVSAAPVDDDTSAQPEFTALQNMPRLADLNAATTSDEKEQLILTMLGMFQDFSSDLKSQADNLRAERDRIKELKESIIRSKKQPPKQ